MAEPAKKKFNSGQVALSYSESVNEVVRKYIERFRDATSAGYNEMAADLQPFLAAADELQPETKAIVSEIGCTVARLEVKIGRYLEEFSAKEEGGESHGSGVVG